MPTAPRLRAGLDENGLGPRLGPMTVTGALLALTATDDALGRAAAAAGIGDSKSLCAHGSMGEVERFVLAVLEVHLGHRPDSLDALLDAVGHETPDALRALCPAGEAPRQCFASPVALPAFGAAPTARDRDVARALLDAGVRVADVRVSLACAKKLNDARDLGRSRFDLDLDAMLSVVDRFRAAAAPAELVARCGKVGGRKSYLAALTRLHPMPEALEETPARSAYRLRGYGEVAFVRDGDATDPAIALASLFGKYARELTMERIYRYYAGRVPGLGRASGYHDPVTARFVDATAPRARRRHRRPLLRTVARGPTAPAASARPPAPPPRTPAPAAGRCPRRGAQ
jgi:ribonuclease HII